MMGLVGVESVQIRCDECVEKVRSASAPRSHGSLLRHAEDRALAAMMSSHLTAQSSLPLVLVVLAMPIIALYSYLVK